MKRTKVYYKSNHLSFWELSGMKGEWVKEKHVDGDLNYIIPEEYSISRYIVDIPKIVEKQFDCITNYILDKYKIEENKVLIHWAFYRPTNIKGIIGQSFTLKGELNGNFALIRIDNSLRNTNTSSEKFIYLFFTALSIPLDFPFTKYNEIKKILIEIANRNGLNLNINRMGIFAPVFYLINDQVDCQFFKEFDIKINEISEQILFHNPIKNLYETKMIYGIHSLF